MAIALEEIISEFVPLSDESPSADDPGTNPDDNMDEDDLEEKGLDTEDDEEDEDPAKDMGDGSADQ